MVPASARLRAIAVTQSSTVSLSSATVGGHRRLRGHPLDDRGGNRVLERAHAVEQGGVRLTR